VSQSAVATNPAFRTEVRERYLTSAPSGTSTMTVGGTAARTAVLLVLLVATGAYGWTSTLRHVPSQSGNGATDTTVILPGGLWLALLLALGFGIACSFNPRRAPILGPLYALCEGYALGAISAAFNVQTEGAVVAAVVATAGVFLGALVAYATKIVRPSAKMAFGVTAAMFGLLSFYLFIWIGSLISSSFAASASFGSVAVVVSLVSVVLAALSFTLDFALIEGAVEAGASREMSWYCAYGLTVTLVWLYLNLLRLIAIFGGR